MKKVVVTVKVKLTMELNNSILIEDVLNDMDYDFSIDNSDGKIVDSEIIDYDIKIK
jgi:hypothetical protein